MILRNGKNTERWAKVYTKYIKILPKCDFDISDYSCWRETLMKNLYGDYYLGKGGNARWGFLAK